MRQEQGFAVALRGVTHSGIPGTPTIVFMIPGNGMVIPHHASPVSLLINRHEDVHVVTGVGSEVIPLIGPYPESWQHHSGWMCAISDVDSRLHHLGVSMHTIKVGANQLPIPGPVVFGIAGRVHASVSTTMVDVPLKGRLLICVQDLARRQ